MTTVVRETCPQCFGAGLVPGGSDFIMCERCYGAGEIEIVLQPKPECSICRRRHGSEVRHECE